jgi:hypothetical protein
VNQKLDVQYQEILALATNIDPRLATWISSRSRVPKILSERPSQTTQE